MTRSESALLLLQAEGKNTLLRGVELRSGRNLKDREYFDSGDERKVAV